MEENNYEDPLKKDHFRWERPSDVVTGGTEGAVQQGPVRARVLNDLLAEERKDDRESQLYDEFEHLRQIKGENIQGYYVRNKAWSDGKLRFQEVCGRYNANKSRKTISEKQCKEMVYLGNSDECDAFESDVMKGPTLQTIVMNHPSFLTEGKDVLSKKETKRCYLTEVIPFFKTLKEHFVGVQTALFKEVKEMEEIFDQMNNEVDKNTVDKQCAEIEKKKPSH
ncbi:hypothetical protein Tco_0705252 [Tanacetum coccineum]|uniref:Uncharacterized protein n=1 Tax=Tanacetum coccineum TaxID=301880 RepID=A0ABQ4Y4X8_9ASTR